MAETYKGHRIGSRKATVRRKYDEEGFEAAVKLGVELGLAEGTIKSWAGGWKKVSTPPKTMVAKEGTKYPEVKLDKVLHTKQRRVHYIGHPDYLGTIIETGPEQSIVRWDNGNKIVICNHWVEDVKI
jgi:hypothetical protein